MTQTYLINMRISTISSISILAVMLFGFWMFSTEHIRIAIVVDVFIATAVAVYMLYCAVAILIHNFKSLIDMPLPETDQYKILNALTADFDSYENIGNIYSQLSGGTRLIQIELYFHRSTTTEEIEQLRCRIEERLRKHFSKLLFHLIPLVKKKDEPASSP